jgi:antibiotic biosynthesis monooxygenase (ABM) superfamily enzyme
MFSAEEIDHSATVVITHRVKNNRQRDYEQWLEEIIPLSKTYPGHLGVQVIRPITDITPTYTAIIRYDSKEHLLAWMKSPERQQLIEKVRPLLADDDAFRVLEGWDFWFTPEASKTKLPTRWKQFLVSWSAIYPLVLLVSHLITAGARTTGLPDNLYLRMLVVTCVVVWLMTYVVMPRYTRLVHRWLFN